MNTHRLLDTGAVADRLPTDTVASVMSTLAGTTAGLAHQVGDHAHQVGSHVKDIDVSDTVRRSRGLVAGVIPWMTPSRSRSDRRRWLMIVAAVIAVGAAVVLLRRRSAGDRSVDVPADRDDWTTAPSADGAVPTSRTDDRQPARSPV